MAGNAVTVGFNNNVTAQEAAQTLGCSYSHIINLIHASKLKAQRKNRLWLVDYDELQRAKSSGMVKARPRNKVRTIAPSSLPERDVVDLRLSISREKFEILKLAFNKDRTLVQYLNDKIDGLYTQINEKLADLSL